MAIPATAKSIGGDQRVMYNTNYILIQCYLNEQGKDAVQMFIYDNFAIISNEKIKKKFIDQRYEKVNLTLY